MMLTQYIFVKEPQTLKEAHVEDCLPNTATVLNLHKDVSAFEKCTSFGQSLASQQKRNNQIIKYQSLTSQQCCVYRCGWVSGEWPSVSRASSSDPSYLQQKQIC